MLESYNDQVITAHDKKLGAGYVATDADQDDWDWDDANWNDGGWDDRCLNKL